MSLLNFLGTTIKPITNLIDEFVTSDEEREKAKAKLQKIQNNLTAKCGNYSRFLTDIVLDSITLKVSSPELAIMEMLLKVPDGESYNEANLIMEGLLTLRPKVVSKLILECKSVKTKRLFLCI